MLLPALTPARKLEVPAVKVLKSSPIEIERSVPPVTLPATKTSASVSVTPGSTPSAIASTTAAPDPAPSK